MSLLFNLFQPQYITKKYNRAIIKFCIIYHVKLATTLIEHFMEAVINAGLFYSF